MWNEYTGLKDIPHYKVILFYHPATMHLSLEIYDESMSMKLIGHFYRIKIKIPQPSNNSIQWWWKEMDLSVNLNLEYVV